METLKVAGNSSKKKKEKKSVLDLDVTLELIYVLWC